MKHPVSAMDRTGPILFGLGVGFGWLGMVLVYYDIGSFTPEFLLLGPIVALAGGVVWVRKGGPLHLARWGIGIGAAGLCAVTASLRNLHLWGFVALPALAWVAAGFWIYALGADRSKQGKSRF